MLPKAVLSLVGRLVGIAAVLVSPLAAAAETTDTPSGADHAAAPAPSHGHRHKGADKKAKKRGSRHAEAAGASKPKSDPKLAHCAAPEVTTERATAKSPPSQSSTPLPSLSAVTAKPLAEAISNKTEVTIESKGHGIEPRRTPIIKASLHTKEAAEVAPRKHAKPICMNAPVNVTRGTEEETFPLTKCDGSALPRAIDEMSILVRPGSAAKPAAPVAEPKAKTEAASGAKDDELAPGIRKIDGRLVERLQLVVDHFAKSAKDGERSTPKIFVVSGYRPSSKGSFHAIGRAIDFKLDGVENTDLVAFCKTLPDTGCGFYPNSAFIHLDVRDSGTGHVSWIDASGPGEKPDYVATWPPPPPNDEDPVKLLAKLDELQILPPAEHDQPAEAPKTEKCPSEPAVTVTRKLEDQ
jgi:hypothetical protein